MSKHQSKSCRRAIPEGLKDASGNPVVWETCQTFSGSWGYYRDEHSWKSTGQLLRMLVDTVSKGGNLLLNIGPTARGDLDRRALDRLRGIGRWIGRHERSIHDCGEAQAEFGVPRDCRLTYDAERKRLFVHIFAWPFRFMQLKGTAYLDRVRMARLVNDGSEIKVLRPEFFKQNRAPLIGGGAS